jgi:hypothetical protein
MDCPHHQQERGDQDEEPVRGIALRDDLDLITVVVKLDATATGRSLDPEPITWVGLRDAARFWGQRAAFLGPSRPAWPLRGRFHVA